MKWRLLIDEGYITADGREVLVDAESREAPAWASVEEACRALVASGSFGPEDLHSHKPEVCQRIEVSDDASFSSLGIAQIWRRVRAIPLDASGMSAARDDEE